MKLSKHAIAAGVAAILIAVSPVSASEMNHDDHGEMNHDAMEGHGTDTAEVSAKINSIDTAERTMNVSHGPVEELGWPSMTMDLPVTKRVDLSTVQAGDDVILSLKQGRDKQFRVIGVEKE